MATALSGSHQELSSVAPPFLPASRTSNAAANLLPNSLSPVSSLATDLCDLAAQAEGESAVASLIAAAANDDAPSLRFAVEMEGVSVDAMAPFPAAGGALRSALMAAASMGAASAVAYLITTGADARAASPTDGATALHCIARSGAPSSSRIIALLLAAGANRDACDNSGRRPADVLAPPPPQLPPMHAAAVPPLPLGNMVSERSSPSAPGSPTTHATNPDAAASGEPSAEMKAFMANANKMMFEFKVTRCPRSRAHDWTECPYAHPGEKAARRDPRIFAYSGTPCPQHRKGACMRGDACELSHGVFETWLHPSRYRTQPCKDGMACERRVCFFSHCPEEEREPTMCFPCNSSPPAGSSNLAAAGMAQAGNFLRGPPTPPRGSPVLSPMSSNMGMLASQGLAGIMPGMMHNWPEHRYPMQAGMAMQIPSKSAAAMLPMSTALESPQDTSLLDSAPGSRSHSPPSSTRSSVDLSPVSPLLSLRAMDAAAASAAAAAPAAPVLGGSHPSTSRLLKSFAATASMARARGDDELLAKLATRVSSFDQLAKSIDELFLEDGEPHVANGSAAQELSQSPPVALSA